MSVDRLLVVKCDNCGAHIVTDEFGDRIDARHYARQVGMRTKRVENGSMWDFCKKCYKREYPNEPNAQE